MSKLIIFGGGGLGSEVIEYINEFDNKKFRSLVLLMREKKI